VKLGILVCVTLPYSSSASCSPKILVVAVMVEELALGNTLVQGWQLLICPLHGPLRMHILNTVEDALAHYKHVTDTQILHTSFLHAPPLAELASISYTVRLANLGILGKL
jgi:hypothetical protein